MDKMNYISYEYKEVSARSDQLSWYLDCYESFGWVQDEKIAVSPDRHMAALRLKRDRKIINKMELTRLQQHFEACMDEIEALERAKTSAAAVSALTVALVGTGFMAGATFAISYREPIIWLCILLAVPGFAGWILPYFLYHWMARRKTRTLQPMIEAKREEIYEICEKGHSLL